MIEKDGWKKIIEKAVRDWDCKKIVSLFSGGYDSMIMTHLIHSVDFGVPVEVWSVDTKLSADGWVDFINECGHKYGWSNHIYDNQIGFDRYAQWVSEHGCVYSRNGHKIAYQKLKDHAYAAILKQVKPSHFDKILFVSGIRRAESDARKKLTEPIQRRGDSNIVFANPLFYWSDEDCMMYRYNHELPTNPFYDTVGGSGDCQCNWGRFIDMDTLKKYSPKLADGNVSIIDENSRSSKGYGWGDEPPKKDDVNENQMPLFDIQDVDESEFTSPFMCSNCSRSKKKPNKSIDEVMLQRGFGW